MNNFTGDLLVKYMDGTRWEVAETFTYRLGSPDGAEFVRITHGFITDFASMPIGVRVVFRSPGGRWDKPAVIHDALYRFAYVSGPDDTTRPVERDECDRIFREAMSVSGVNRLARWCLYAGVRAGGWWAWQRHRKGSHDVVETVG